MALRIGHDRGVNQAELEIREPDVYFGGPPQQPIRKKGDGMFPGRNGLQEPGSGVPANPRPKQLVDLHKHEIGD